MSERDNPKAPILDDQVCFQLYLASRNMMKAYKTILSALDLTYPQYLVMMVLWEHQTTTVKQLGDLLGLDSGTLSPLLKRMIEKDLLAKKRDPNDERGVLVSLTKSGLAMKAKSHCIPTELIKSADLDSSVHSLLKPLKALNRKLEKASE